MNGTFDRNGHVTVRGFESLVTGKAGELTRLELAEHLDWCDRCVDRYSLLLSDVPLMEPPEDLSETVMASIRRRMFTVFTSQAAKVCAAACLAIVIWCGGIFDGDLMAKGENFSEKMAEGGMNFSRSVSDFGDVIENWLSELNLSGLSMSGLNMSGLSINTRGVEYGTEESIR